MSGQLRAIQVEAGGAPSPNLAALEPKETDKRLAAALPIPIPRCLRESHFADYRLKGFEIERLPAAEHLPAVEEAIRNHEFAMRPAPTADLSMALTRLRVMTKARPDDEAEGALRAAAYLEELQRWPGDVAMHVLTTQPRMDKWWPAWAEIEERLDLYAGERKKRLEALVELSHRMMIRAVLLASDKPLELEEIEQTVGIEGLRWTLFQMTRDRTPLDKGGLRELEDRSYQWEVPP